MADQNTNTAAAPKADEAPKAAAQAAAAPARAAANAGATVAKAAKPARKPRAAKAARTAKPARKAAGRRSAAQKAAPQKAAVTRSVNKINDNVNEGTRKMKNEANKVADRVQAVFGDASERAKTAFERNSRFAEELTELSKGNVEALVASTKLAAKGVEKIGQEVAELSRKSFEEASAALKGFAEVKSPTDFFRLQGEFARGQFDTLVAESAKLSETMIKLAGDVAQPLTGRYTVAAERVKSAVAL
jgi:phasin family protein